MVKDGVYYCALSGLNPTLSTVEQRRSHFLEVRRFQISKMKSTIYWMFIISFMIINEIHCCPDRRELPVAISYSELEDLNAECHPMDTCHKPADHGGLNETSCDCDSSCSLYDTCCLDSEFRVHTPSHKPKNNLKCLHVYGTQLAVFMVDSCRNDDTSESLCFSDPEEENDPFLMVPVTSSVSGITYKNYFCAVCNEDVDSEHLELWDINVYGNGTLLKNLFNPKFRYDTAIKSWTVSVGKDDADSTPVPVTLQVNQSTKATAKYCSSDLVEDCSGTWTDKSVEEKCKAYMAKVTIFRDNTDIRYRNPHCALCNFEDLTSMDCLALSPGRGSITYFKPGTPLLDLFIAARKRCGADMIYDKFADKCRCNSKLFKMQNGKCVNRT